MPKIQKTTKTTAAKTTRKSAKKCPCGEKCSCKKSCKCESETHSLKNLAILWLCIFSAAFLGIVAYSWLIPIIKSNASLNHQNVEVIDTEKN